MAGGSKPVDVAGSFQFLPELLDLLVEAIPRLCRSKQNVVDFFRSAGLRGRRLDGWEHRIQTDRDSVRKHEIARDLLMRINEVDDRFLRLRREVIKRVVEFEDFSTCWPDDQHAARGLVERVRAHVNAKDSFTSGL